MALDKRRIASGLVVALFSVAIAQAEEARDPVEALQEKGYATFSVTPIFSQLVSLRYPNGFKPAFSNATPTFYVQEAVPKGETVEQWSQMITVTGSKGNSESKATGMTLLQSMAGGFQRRCPSSFVAKALGKVTIAGYEGFIALIGCGTVTPGPPHSELAFVIAVKGSTDIYSIQWAERGAASEQPPVLDEPLWKSRFQQLLPIRICDRVPDEAPPYPSCINQP
jgi:hypothetical protein